jgi:hypothetical protein
VTYCGRGVSVTTALLSVVTTAILIGCERASSCFGLNRADDFADVRGSVFVLALAAMSSKLALLPYETRMVEFLERSETNTSVANSSCFPDVLAFVLVGFRSSTMRRASLFERGNTTQDEKVRPLSSTRSDSLFQCVCFLFSWRFRGAHLARASGHDSSAVCFSILPEGRTGLRPVRCNAFLLARLRHELFLRFFLRVAMHSQALLQRAALPRDAGAHE